MRLTGHVAPSDEAQEIMWDAMDVAYDDETKASSPGLPMSPGDSSSPTDLREEALRLLEFDLVREQKRSQRADAISGRKHSRKGRGTSGG